MTCALTAAEDTDYGHPHSFASYQRYLKIHVNTLNPGKKNKGIKVILSSRKTSCKQSLCAPALPSCTVPSLHAKACIHSINRSFQCSTYSIQNLRSPKTARSMQTTTLWAGFTNTSDMRIDNSRPHQLWTHAQARPKQMTSDHLY